MQRMRCSYDALVAGPLDRVWAAVTDVDAVLAALPAATLVRDGDVATGSLTCRLNGGQVTYRINARAEPSADDPHSALVVVTGKEARGDGTMAATLTVTVAAEGSATRLDLNGDAEATGRAAGADEQAWSRVLARLVDAAVTDRLPDGDAPATAPADRTGDDVPLTEALPDPIEALTAGGIGRRPRILVGLAVAALLVAMGWLLSRGGRRARR
jgi:uncharacterized protein